MQIFVRGVLDKTITLGVQSSDTIANVKSQIFAVFTKGVKKAMMGESLVEVDEDGQVDATGLNLMRLQIGTRRLANEYTLSRYNIQDMHTLFFYWRLTRPGDCAGCSGDRKCRKRARSDEGAGVEAPPVQRRCSGLGRSASASSGASSDRSAEKPCSACGENIRIHAKFCDQCGEAQE